MTNEQYYLVRLPLTDEQCMLANEAPHKPGFQGTRLEASICAVATPIQPCADVETVGYGRETSFAELKERGCHAVSIHKAWDGGIPLVRRTDMEAQVARVAAEKDAEIARLKDMLSLFVEYEKLMDDGEDVAAMSVYADFTKEVTAALNEGAAK
ncbi:hypothetical protein [Komagataeibacter phage phiKX1]|nr:hypothetical protein [Komagataeibacter phage phiKX1]